MAFKNCNAIKNLVFNNLSEIKDQAYMHCNSLKTVCIHSVSVIHDSAFEWCKSLEYVEICAHRLLNCVFRQCTGLVTIYLINVTQIGGYCFEGCKRVRLLNISTVMMIFGKYPFANMSSIEAIDISGLRDCNACNGIFSGCLMLRSVQMGCRQPGNFPSDAFVNVSNYVVRLWLRSVSCLKTNHWRVEEIDGKIYFCGGFLGNVTNKDEHRTNNNNLILIISVCASIFILSSIIVIFVVRCKRQHKDITQRLYLSLR